MATLVSFFRDVFTIEEQVKAMVFNYTAKLTPADVLEAPREVLEFVVTAIATQLQTILLNAAEAGREFGTSVGAGASTAQLSISHGVTQFITRAQVITEQTVIEVEYAIAQQLGAGITVENVRLNPVALSAWSAKIAEAAENTVQLVASTSMQEVVIGGDPGGMDALWTWITVHDNRVCDDCKARHNKTKTMREWAALGLPKSGFSVCGDRDRCMLMPADYVDEKIDLNQPVKLTRDDIAQFGGRVADMVE